MDVGPHIVPINKPSQLRRTWWRWGIGVLSLSMLGGLVASAWMRRTITALSPLVEDFQTFATILVAIFIEAVPFLLFGVLLSALFETFVGAHRLQRLLPDRRFRAIGTASVLGLSFPICDCGLIPIGRGMMRNGVAPYAALTFMLAAPIMNPIVLWSTWVAFSNRPGIIALRFGLTMSVAWTVGLLLSTFLRRQTFLPGPASVPRSPVSGHVSEASHPVPPGDCEHVHPHGHPPASSNTAVLSRVRQAVASSIGEFTEMSAFLTIGATVAAALQVLLPQSALLELGGGPVLSVVILMALRAMLSVCATVDAFLALAFAPAFSPGAVVAFLAFGPVFDLKNLFVLGGMFSRKLVLLYLVVVTPLIFLGGVGVNLLFPRL